MDTVGERFKKWRIDNDISAKDIESKTNIRVSTISDIETNKVLPSGKTLIPILLNYDVPIDYILTGRTDKLIDNNLIEIYHKLNAQNKKKAIVELRYLYDNQIINDLENKN